jgi:cytochrome c biogenesis protein
VCIGGLLDGDLVVRAQTWFNGKSVFTGGGMIADVAPEHRLSASNPTFRGNILVPEGGQGSVANPEPVRRRAAAGAAVFH